MAWFSVKINVGTTLPFTIQVMRAVALHFEGHVHSKSFASFHIALVLMIIYCRFKASVTKIMTLYNNSDVFFVFRHVYIILKKKNLK